MKSTVKLSYFQLHTQIINVNIKGNISIKFTLRHKEIGKFLNFFKGHKMVS